MNDTLKTILSSIRSRAVGAENATEPLDLLYLLSDLEADLHEAKACARIMLRQSAEVKP